VIVYYRENDPDRTDPLTRFHPEFRQPADKAPYELGCAELAQSSAPQLLCANLQVAGIMVCALLAWLNGELGYEEAYADILRAKMTSVGAAGRAKPRRGGLSKRLPQTRTQVNVREYLRTELLAAPSFLWWSSSVRRKPYTSFNTELLCVTSSPVRRPAPEVHAPVVRSSISVGRSVDRRLGDCYASVLRLPTIA